MATDDTTRDDAERDEQAETAAREQAGREKSDRDRDRRPAEPDRDDQAGDDEKARLKKALSEANRKAAADRKRLEELEAAEADRKREQMTEADRVKADRAEADRRAREAEDRARQAEAALLNERVNSAVERAAQSHGFEYPEDVPKLIDRDRIEVDEESGRIDLKTVNDAVERLARARPGLINARRGGGTPPRETQRRPAESGVPHRGARNVDPYEQELIDMGRGGYRM